MAKNVPAAKAKDEPLVLVQTQVPDYIKQEGGRGSENVTTDDVVIPRLEVIQALSPAVKRGDPGFIKGAEAGMLMNSVTKQLYGEECFVIPVFYTKQWLVWKARKDKAGKPLEGGFFGAYNTPEEAERRAKEEGGEAKNIEIIDTPQHFCLLIDVNTGKAEEIMLSMPRTKAKISRQWNSMIKLGGGDRFSRVYRVVAQLEKNPKGDFYNFAIASSGFPARKLYDQAEKVYEAIAAGHRRVVMDVSDLDATEGGGNPEM